MQIHLVLFKYLYFSYVFNFKSLSEDLVCIICVIIVKYFRVFIKLSALLIIIITQTSIITVFSHRFILFPPPPI